MSTATSTDVLRMTLADVARAAAVQRPVVSMWRARRADGPTPFPNPTATAGGLELWTVADVVDWFLACKHAEGRVPGNNESVVADLPRFARIDQAALGGVDIDTLSALLALSAITGEDLADLPTSEVARLAGETDPDDQCLLSELAASQVTHRALELCDELADASYSARAALDVLAEGDIRAAGHGFAPELVNLLVESVIGVGHALGADPLRLTLLSPSLLAVGLEVSARDPLARLTVISHNAPADRGAIRRLRALDAGVTVLPYDDGDLPSDGSGVVVGDVTARSTCEALDDVDGIVLQLASAQAALFVGTSAALSNKLTSASDVKLRDQWLRTGQLRFVTKLPAGVMRHRHSARISMALFGDAPRGVPQTSLRVVTGDLGATALADLDADDVVTDLVVATSAHVLGREHLLRSARLVTVPALLAANGDLSARAVADADRDPSRGVDRSIVLSADDLRAAVGPVGAGWAVVTQPHPTTVRACTIDHAIRQGWLRLVPGNRIRDEHLNTNGLGARVIGQSELTSAAARPRSVDRMELEWRYPATRFTRPGDVVFSPTAGAVVDDDGDAVVQAPARILRVTDVGRVAGFSPHVLAFDLARQAAPARDVKLLRVRPVAPGQGDQLAIRLEVIATRRAQLRDELARLDELDDTLVESVASGYARIEPTDHRPARLTPPEEKD